MINKLLAFAPTIVIVLRKALFQRGAPKSNYHHRNGQHVTHGDNGQLITDITRTDPSGIDLSCYDPDPSSTDPPAAAKTRRVSITGIDFESNIFFPENDAVGNDDIPLEDIVEEVEQESNSR